MSVNNDTNFYSMLWHDFHGDFEAVTHLIPKDGITHYTMDKETGKFTIAYASPRVGTGKYENGEEAEDAASIKKLIQGTIIKTNNVISGVLDKASKSVKFDSGSIYAEVSVFFITTHINLDSVKATEEGPWDVQASKGPFSQMKKISAGSITNIKVVWDKSSK